jgi:TBC1 domain family protein 5
VRDALKLRESLTQETAQKLVFKHTGRRISKASLATPLRFSKNGPSGPSPASLETILHDAARGVMSRSERWGLNRTLRDVLGEVRRNVKTVQSSAGNASPGRSSSVESRSKSRTASHSTIAANALRRINALEARNMKLGQMLERASLEMAEVVKELEETQTAKDQAAKLGSAASTVQTVHTFLKDISLPLPDENITPDSHDPLADGPTVAASADTAGQKPPGPKPQLQAKNDRERSPPSRLGVAGKSTSAASPLVRPRPHISESPLSWMLAGNQDRGEAVKPSFLNAPPQRHSRNPSSGSEARSAKGYLFGDMDDRGTRDDQHDARARSQSRDGTMEISLEDMRAEGARADVP